MAKGNTKVPVRKAHRAAPQYTAQITFSGRWWVYDWEDPLCLCQTREVANQIIEAMKAASKASRKGAQK